MEARVRRFRRQVRLENRGRSGIRRRYSRSLRAEAVAYLRERVQGGASAETVASELGVSGWSLSRWRRGLSPEKNSTLQLVEVVADCAEEGTKPLVTLVTPDGYRIEGLERDDVGRMLESLR